MDDENDIVRFQAQTPSATHIPRENPTTENGAHQSETQPDAAKATTTVGGAGHDDDAAATDAVGADSTAIKDDNRIVASETVAACESVGESAQPAPHVEAKQSLYATNQNAFSRHEPSAVTKREQQQQQKQQHFESSATSNTQQSNTNQQQGNVAEGTRPLPRSGPSDTQQPVATTTKTAAPDWNDHGNDQVAKDERVAHPPLNAGPGAAAAVAPGTTNNATIYTSTSKPTAAESNNPGSLPPQSNTGRTNLHPPSSSTSTKSAPKTAQAYQPRPSATPVVAVGASTMQPPAPVPRGSSGPSTTAGTPPTKATHTSSSGGGVTGVQGSPASTVDPLAEVHKARSPLTDLYGPFIMDHDTSLQDARQRLRTALDQTLRLRRAFTERVYTKYRVCLIPPDADRQHIVNEPDSSARYQKIEEERAAIKREKDLEKNMLQKLQQGELSGTATAAALSTMPAISSTMPGVVVADTPDQLLYYSAGLNLIILPEHDRVDPSWLSKYSHGRGPIDPNTGQRSRSLSQAAATAGEVMLDRARRATVMRIERQHREQSQQMLSSSPFVGATAGFSGVDTATPMAVVPAPYSFSTTQQKSTITPTQTPKTVATSVGTGVKSGGPVSNLTPAVTNLKQPPPPAPPVVNKRTAVLTPATQKPTTPTIAAPKVAPPAIETALSPSGKSTTSKKKRQKSTDGTGTAAPSTTKASHHRSRPQAILSTATLLSVTPTADEIDVGFSTESISTGSGNSAKRRSALANSSPIPTNFSAATSALISRSTNNASAKTMQQRLKHPYPDSLGGRRRANSAVNSSSTATASEPPFLEAYLALTLPPIPAVRERLERKPLAVCTPEQAAPERAKASIKAVLTQFTGTNGTQNEENNLIPLTKIGLLHGLRNVAVNTSSSNSNTDAKLDETVAKSLEAGVPNVEMPSQALPTPALQLPRPPGMSTCDEPSAQGPLDAAVAFSVLHALGLFHQGTSESLSSLPAIDQNCPIWSDKLKHLHNQISNNRTTLVSSMLSRHVYTSSKRPADINGIGVVEPSLKRPCTEAGIIGACGKEPDENNEVMDLSANIPAERIRGGGEIVAKDEAEERKDSSVEENMAKTKTDNKPGLTNAAAPVLGVPSTHSNSSSETGVVNPSTLPRGTGKRKAPIPRQQDQEMNTQNVARQRKYSDPGLTLTQKPSVGMPAPAPGMTSHLAMPSAQYPQAGSALNAYHLANQLRNIRHPAGELADYMGTLHRAYGYDVSTLLQAQQAGVSLPTLGMLPPGNGLLNYDAAAARAVFAQEQAQQQAQQQAAAILNSGGYQRPVQYQAPLSALMHAPYTMAPPAQMQHPVSLTAHTNTPTVQQKPGTAANQVGAKQPEKKPASQVKTSKKHPEKKSVAEKPAMKSPPSQDVETQNNSSVKGAPSISSDACTEETRKGESHESGATKSNEPIGSKDSDDCNSNPVAIADKGGMKFFEPERPVGIDGAIADLILLGKFDQAVDCMTDTASHSAALDFLLSVGAAVPIPKALVMNAFKDKLNSLFFKNLGNSAPHQIPRDHAAAMILVWLWNNYRHTFQEAFEKSGRTDVDPACKWLAQACAEVAVKALSVEISDSISKGEGPFFDIARKNHHGAPKVTLVNESDLSQKLELRTTLVICKALSLQFHVDTVADKLIPHFQLLVQYLDEARLCALRTKAKERTLLANLVARRATMTESFAQAYTSSTVRAGEALGHDNLFDTVQDEDVHTSSMMAHDIITYDDDQWEDPCKPEGGFTPGLGGDDLMRRAHARALIQKALRKVQDRNHIRGGTPGYGPYVDPNTEAAGGSGGPTVASGGMSPRMSYKRRSTSFVESQLSAGSGSARAKNWAVYEPSHISPPLEWRQDHSENTPYGLHRVGDQVRSLSATLTARSGEPRSSKKAKKSHLEAASPSVLLGESDTSNPFESSVPKSTRKIDWADIAGIFQSVELPRKSPPSKSGKIGEKGKPGKGIVSRDRAPPAVGGRTIFAPFCRKIMPEDLVAAGDLDESDSEEDVSDETVLARHQHVLDEMKAKLDLFLEARRRQQERRKSSKLK